MKKLFIRRRHCERTQSSALVRSLPAGQAGNLLFWGSPARMEWSDGLHPTHNLRLVLAMTAFIFVFASCGKSLPQLDGVDLKQWQDDKNGCNHYREKTTYLLSSQFDKLKALDESQIVKLLGKPDQTELYRRNQKFYTYFLEPSTKCDPSIDKSKKMVIRFNGIRMSKEVEIE